MEKIQIKSDNLTPFGGIFHIFDQFDKHLSSLIEKKLGIRSRLFGYQYSEIFRAIFGIFFCRHLRGMGKGGGMRVVDINLDIWSVFCQIRYPDKSIGMPKWFLFFCCGIEEKQSIGTICSFQASDNETATL